MSSPTQSPTVYEAVITPHRSIGARGLRWVAGSLAALSALVSVGLWLAGAWPVIGFTGLEIVLAVTLLVRHNMRKTDSEILLLSDDAIRIIHTRRGVRSERKLPVGWLRADLEERPGRAPALVLRGRRTAVEVAAMLGEDEKRELAVSLRAALARQRSPVFDNAQLRAVEDGAEALRPPSVPST